MFTISFFINVFCSQTKCIPLDVVKSFVKKCCIKSGAKEEHASDLADLLVAADHRGHFSHDLNRLGDLQHFYIY